VRINSKKYRKFKSEALKYIIQDGHFFRRVSKNVLIRRVIDDLDDRFSIL
jgi:hypothetical protein